MTVPNNKPTIGITSLSGKPAWTSKNTANYIRVVEENSLHYVILAPDTPALLPDGRQLGPNSDGSLPDEILNSLDGVILSGGGDVHPSHFGQTLNGAEVDRIDLRRDALELTLAHAALERHVPLFGICRGCQVLNVAAGGSLVQHLDGHRSPENATKFHQVRVVPGGRLHSAANGAELTVNTFHHQGVGAADVAPGFRATGMAEPDTWLVEAIESTNQGWAVGVQWHPERTFELDESHIRIWTSFFDACADRMSHRQT